LDKLLMHLQLPNVAFPLLSNFLILNEFNFRELNITNGYFDTNNVSAGFMLDANTARTK
jgi:hypothetical protein